MAGAARPGIGRSALRCAALVAAGLLSACAAQPPSATFTIPPDSDYCAIAQQVVSRTQLPAQLVVHADYAAFVKSKAAIDEANGAIIHQYAWVDTDGMLLGFACKMNSSDDLQRVFGAGSAGPEGYCHDMNRRVYTALQAELAGNELTPIVFEPSESLDTKEQQNMIGPVWLQPFELTWASEDGAAIHVATRGFVVEYADPRYQKLPADWRGTHYCHLIAPSHLRGLMLGEVQPGRRMARKPLRGRTPESFRE